MQQECQPGGELKLCPTHQLGHCSSQPASLLLCRPWIPHAQLFFALHVLFPAPLQAAHLTREQILDRYEQHTRDCPHCSRVREGRGEGEGL